MTHDPLFNESAAAWAHDLIMKMDEDAALPFATMVIAETLWDEIAKNARTLQRHLNEVVAKRQARLVTALDRVVAKGADAEQVSTLRAAMEQVRKDYDVAPYDKDWDPREHPRGHAGRFTFKIQYSGKQSPVKDKYAARIPNMPSASDPKLTGLSGPEKAKYQEGYMQIANFLASVNPGDNDDVIYTFRDKTVGGRAGRLYWEKRQGNKIPDIDPKTTDFAGVEIVPKNIKDKNQVDLATFGLLSALGDPALAAYGAHQMNLVDANITPFATDWSKTGQAGEKIGSSNARLYDRLATGSQYLSEFQTPGSKAWIATKFAQFVGQRGPEAEKVIGPRARKTMYRYRGIEKKPDQEIVDYYNRARGFSATMATPEQAHAQRVAENRAIGAAKRRLGRDLTKDERAQIIAGVKAQAQGVSGAPAEAAQYMTTRGRNALVEQMGERIPDAQYYDLQLKSGHTPPSEGVIIDRHGNVVTQAVGYADDHYLPFNLKNLKGLRGGSYIRTRSVGGPTTEDIYTGLMTGAREITVVSRSGVFTVRFADDFRGTRRYNDKAARMVRRYGKILDAVQSSQADRQPLEPDIKRQIRDEVNRTMSYASPADRKAAVERKEREAKLYPQISDKDREKVEQRAAQMERNGDLTGAAAYRRDALNSLLESKAYTWKLNGEGYGAAIDSLYEQFPYYFDKPTYEPRRQATYEAEPDRGYVKARHLRPAAAQEGYFDASIAGESKTSEKNRKKTGTKERHGKTPADQVDYQNWRHNPGNEKVEEAEAREQAREAPETGAGGERGARELTRTQAQIEQLRQSEREEGNRAIALKLWKRVTTLPGRDGNPRVASSVQARYPKLFRTGMSEDEFVASWKDIKPEFEDFAEKYIKPGDAFDAEENADWGRYKANKGGAGTKMFDKSLHLDVTPAEPYGFPGAAYAQSANRATRRGEMEELNKNTPLTPLGKPLEQYSSKEDFTSSIDAIRKLRKRADLIRGSENRDQMMADLVEQNEIPDMPRELIQAGIDDGQTLDQFQENILRYWLLWTREQEAGPGDFAAWESEPPTPPTPSGPTTPSTPSAPSTPGPRLVQLTPAELEARRKSGQVVQAQAQAAQKRRSDIYKAWYDKLDELQTLAKGLGDEEKANDIEEVITDLDTAIDNPLHPEAVNEIKPKVQSLMRRHNDLVNPLLDLPPLPDAWVKPTKRD